MKQSSPFEKGGLGGINKTLNILIFNILTPNLMTVRQNLHALIYVECFNENCWQLAT